jgi:hypothetical protein
MVKKRTYLRIHTYIPDDDHVEKWLSNLITWSHTDEQDLKKYANIYASPDSQKMQNYAAGKNFYNPDDSIIQFAQLVRSGVTNTSMTTVDLVKSSGSQSEYAQAVSKGVSYIQAANQFFHGKISETTLKGQLFSA